MILFFIHAIYISVIDFNIDADSYADVTLKIFSDDLSDAVRDHRGAIISREGVYEPSDLESIQSYLDYTFIVHDKMDTIRFELIEHSTEDQAVWLKLKSKSSLMSNAQLTASYLLEMFPDQVNMVHLKMKEEKLFYQIKNGKETIDLGLDKILR